MEFFQILACTDEDMKVLFGVIQTVMNVIRWVIPIILIVMGTMDIAKVVTTSNNDEKEVKAATKKLTTRVIYAIVIFLIPTIVSLIFKLLPSNIGAGADLNGNNWKDCWDGK